MTNPVSFERRGRIGILRIANPPLNALSCKVIEGLAAAIDAFEADRSVEALLLHCDGRTFVTDADMAIFEDPSFDTTIFNCVLGRLEQSERLVATTVHGTALGRGLELALACHYRVGLSEARVGLPEVKLGILPGSLGSQRLPRLVGAELALNMIQTGRLLDAHKARDAGILDALDEGDPLEIGLRFVNGLLDRGVKPRRVSEFTVRTEKLPHQFFAKAMHEATTKEAAHPAARAIVQAVEAAATLSFQDGEAVEKALFMHLAGTRQSKALRHLFFAERAASEIPGLQNEMSLRVIKKVGIVGAGTMGGGIAMNFANAGFPTVIVETSQEALDRGLSIVRKNYQASVAKGKLAPEEAAKSMGLLAGSLDDAELRDCDLVIEAVYEDTALKKQVCARLGEVCKPDAIIATNTSTLDVDVLAQATGRPADVVGMHFFSPANVMRLLEIVRGARTSPEVLATVMRLAGIIKKVAVVSGVCYGFIGNRMAEVYLREADFLMLEGASPSQIDGAVQSSDLWGMAMGPCRMLDMAGVDVAAKTLIERDKEGQLPPDPSYRAVVRKLYELGRMGQKSAAGYYRYDGRTAQPDQETERICAELARQHGVTRRRDISDQEIIERLLYPMINEGARILEERIAYRPGDIDLIWVAGYGFPDYRGGPMFMADQVGLATIVAGLRKYAQARGNTCGYWTTSSLLNSLVDQNGCLSNWTA